MVCDGYTGNNEPGVLVFELNGDLKMHLFRCLLSARVLEATPAGAGVHAMAYSDTVHIDCIFIL